MQEDQAIKLFKCLSDKSRLHILKSLMQEDMYVERLAERLALSPATISFHLKKLEDAGCVCARKEQYYTVYSLRREVFMARILDLIAGESSEAELQAQRDAEYREKILKTFFVYNRLVSIPAQRKKRRICLEVIAESFEPGRPYDEKTVNETILRFHDDYCTIRREMICEGIMDRVGGTYTRI